MGPSGRELEFIIRFKEFASANIDKVTTKLKGLGSTAASQRTKLREVGRAMEDVGKKSTLIGTGMERIDGASANATTTVGRLTDKLRFLGSSTATTRKQMRDARIAMAAMGKEGGTLQQGAERMNVSARKAAGGIRKISEAAKRAGPNAGLLSRTLAKTGLNMDRFRKKTDEAGKGQSKFDKLMKNTTKSVQLMLGPLSGISARLTAFTGIVSQATFKIAFFSAALVGMVAIGAAARSAAKEIDKVFKASQRLGLSFEKFQELEFIASQSGIDAAQFTKGLEALSTRISDASAGAGEAKKTFKALGLETRTLVNKRPIEQFELIRAGLNKITNETDRAAAASKIFSRANVQMSNMLRLTRAEFDALGKQARDYGLILSTEVAEDAVRATDAMDLLAKVLDKNFKRVLAQLFPSITSFSLLIAKIGPLVKDNADIIIAALATLGAALTGPFIFAVTGAFALPLTALFAILAGAAVFAFTNLDLVIGKLKELEKIGVGGAAQSAQESILDSVDKFINKNLGAGGFLIAETFIKLFRADVEGKELAEILRKKKAFDKKIDEAIPGREKVRLFAQAGRDKRESDRSFDPAADFDDIEANAEVSAKKTESVWDKAITTVRKFLESLISDVKKILKGDDLVGTDKFTEQFEKLRDKLKLQRADLSFINAEFDELGGNFEEAANKSRLFQQALSSQSSIMAATGVTAERFPPMGEVMRVLAGDADTFTSKLGLEAEELKRVLELLILIRDVEGNKALVASQRRVQSMEREADLLNVRMTTFFATGDEQERALRIRETELRLLASGLEKTDEQFIREVRITEELIRREQILRKIAAARDALTTASERGIQQIGLAFSDVFLDAEKGFADLEDTATKVFKKITDMVITLAIINPAINSLGLPGGGQLPTLGFGSGNPLGSLSTEASRLFSGGKTGVGFSDKTFGFAKGGVLNRLQGIKDSFANQNIKRAARGTVLTEPTFIKAGNDIVHAREAGQDEGILPLRRMRSGDLGVSANISTPPAQSLNVNVFQTIKSDNPTNFRATLGQQFRAVRRATDRAFARG